MRTNRTLIVADGENLVLRFQALLAEGAQQTEGTRYQKDTYVWHPNIVSYDFMDIVRVSYYMTYVGNAETDAALKKTINEVKYSSRAHRGDVKSVRRLVPHTFKKEKGSAKIKSVDINMTIDALRHTYNDSIDALFLLSGDGDFVPLIEEVMRQGKRVMVGAFSSGLNPRMENVGDDFVLLDQWTVRQS